MNYYDDLTVKVAVQHFFLYGNYATFTAENNSIEFIRTGHVKLKRDGEVIELTAPAIFWMRAGHRYGFELPAESSTKCEHLYFDFSGPRSERMIDELDRIAPRGEIMPHDPALCGKLFLQVLQNYRMDPVANHPQIVVDIERILLLAVESTCTGKLKKDDPYHLEDIAEKIRANPFGRYDFRAVATQEGISYHHYRRLFRNWHKVPLKNYVFNQQMLLVAEMLVKTDMRIKEIMAIAMFDSMMNFSRSFKRFSGLSPVAYRKKFRKSSL